MGSNWYQSSKAFPDREQGKNIRVWDGKTREVWKIASPELRALYCGTRPFRFLQALNIIQRFGDRQ